LGIPKGGYRLKGKVHKYGADVDTDAIILSLLDMVPISKIRDCLVWGFKGAKPL